MPPILGNVIVIAVLGIIIFFAGRKVIRDLKSALRGDGCAECGGGCSSCGESGCGMRISEKEIAEIKSNLAKKDI